MDFSDIKFIAGATSIEQIPANLSVPEIAFIGRSNVGKSSLINAITKQDIARVSKTPGRTQQINFFYVNNRLYFADLPGYGYAAVSKSIRKSWNHLIFDYLRGRVNLKRAFLLIDARHGLKMSDIEVMDILDENAVVYQIILTKADKQPEISKIQTAVENSLKSHPAAFPEILISSSEKYQGIKEIQRGILTLC